jgi:predicted nuclease of restriction endonuclease-like RecB superfamily
MLTADLVHTRRKGAQLFVVPLGARREAAIDLATSLLGAAEAHESLRREELDAALEAIEVEPRDDKLKQGLFKLIEDEIAFEVDAQADPVALRSEVFERAASARREGRFDRDALLGELAQARGIEPERIERALYADLKAQHVVRFESRAVFDAGPEALVRKYEAAQPQAILLRATQVIATVTPRDAASTRALFRKLKFLGLLYGIVRDGTRLRITIDGPFNLFAQTTKYGVALARALPVLTGVGPHEILADVRWGKERVPLRFEMRSDAADADADAMDARLGDDAQSLFDRWSVRESDWVVKPAAELVDVPGRGVVVPDLAFTHVDGTRVLVEVMGFSARDAVFARVALAESGALPPMIFCASDRLRVSEGLLPDDSAASLVVYKGVIPLGGLEEKLERLRKGRSGARR